MKRVSSLILELGLARTSQTLALSADSNLEFVHGGRHEVRTHWNRASRWAWAAHCDPKTMLILSTTFRGVSGIGRFVVHAHPHYAQKAVIEEWFLRGSLFAPPWWWLPRCSHSESISWLQDRHSTVRWRSCKGLDLQTRGVFQYSRHAENCVKVASFSHGWCDLLMVQVACAKPVYRWLERVRWGIT